MVQRNLIRLVLPFLLCMTIAATASAQYGGGGSMGSTGTTSGYSNGGYSSHTGLAIGVAAAAAGAVGLIYYLHHKHAQAKNSTGYRQTTTSSLAGCTAATEGGLVLVDQKEKRTYSLVGASPTLSAGERIEMTGQKSIDPSGNRIFRVQSLVANEGSCKPDSGLTTAELLRH